jgi:hypothetical protein
MKGLSDERGRTPAMSAAASIFCLISVIFAQSSQASYYFQVLHSSSGGNKPGTNMYVDLSGGADCVDFTFHNENSFKSSISRIYFDLDLLGCDFTSITITNGPGTKFSENFPGPKNLPGGNGIVPSFHSDISIGAKSPPPKNGINPGEWLKVSFGLPAGETPADIIDEINNGRMPVGIHVSALPSGSSESAILVPDPATFCLLGLGGLTLLRRRRCVSRI